LYLFLFPVQQPVQLKLWLWLANSESSSNKDKVPTFVTYFTYLANLWQLFARTFLDKEYSPLGKDLLDGSTQPVVRHISHESQLWPT